MTKKYELQKNDMMNICRGAGFFASGGGGSVEQTHDIIEYIWNKDKLPNKKPVMLYQPEIIPDTDWLASVAMIGSPDALTATPNKCRYASVNSFKTLSEKTKKEIKYLVSVETGSINITIPMLVAAINGLPYVDCTGTARSVPKLQDTTYAVGGVDSSPAAFANDQPQGVTQYLVAEGLIKVDSLARNVIQNPKFNQISGLSNFIMTGQEMKQTGSLGCVTMAKELGEALSQAKIKNNSPFDVIHSYLLKANRKSYLLGKGEITDKKIVKSGGFDALNITIETANDTITVVALNENLLAWSDKKSSPIAMAPDLISYVDENYQVFSNADIEKGQKIMLIAAQATTEMRQPELVNSFLEEIKTMGYYGPYVKIEDINK